MSNLSHLNDGDTAYIIRVRGSHAFRLRLEEMGFVPGQEVKRLYVALLGSPIIFSMMGQQIALRQSEAEGVAVAPTLSEVPFDQRETAEVYEIGAHTPTPTCPRGLENVPGVREHPMLHSATLRSAPLAPVAATRADDASAKPPTSPSRSSATPTAAKQPSSTLPAVGMSIQAITQASPSRRWRA